MSTSTDPGAGRPVSQKVPHVRVLLKADFDPFEISGAERAERIRVEVQGHQIQLSRLDGGKVSLLARDTGFRLEPKSGYLLVDKTLYRGRIDVFMNPLGQPVAVNDLSLEEYLRSVVPQELGPFRFPEVEALKAQAVAARTFAVASLGNRADLGFDIFSDTRSQVYPGLASEHPLSDRAVAETRGIVATFEESPIYSLYSSTCGGETEDFHLIFKGAPIEYLRGGASCDDGSSPYHTWSESIDLSSRTTEIQHYTGFPKVRSLEQLAFGKSGRTVQMLFSGAYEERVLKGNDIRFALGLRSNWILDMRAIKDQQGFIERLEVDGRGWGHGVGLCQIGAVEMAQSGRTFQEILKHYYRGIALQNWY